MNLLFVCARIDGTEVLPIAAHSSGLDGSCADWRYWPFSQQDADWSKSPVKGCPNKSNDQYTYSIVGA